MNRKTGFIIYVIVFQICWHLLNLAYNTLITGKGYQFDSGIDIAFPIVLALLTGYFLVLKRGEKKTVAVKGAGNEAGNEAVNKAGNEAANKAGNEVRGKTGSEAANKAGNDSPESGEQPK